MTSEAPRLISEKDEVRDIAELAASIHAARNLMRGLGHPVDELVTDTLVATAVVAYTNLRLEQFMAELKKELTNGQV